MQVRCVCVCVFTVASRAETDSVSALALVVCTWRREKEGESIFVHICVWVCMCEGTRQSVCVNVRFSQRQCVVSPCARVCQCVFNAVSGQMVVKAAASFSNKGEDKVFLGWWYMCVWVCVCARHVFLPFYHYENRESSKLILQVIALKRARGGLKSEDLSKSSALLQLRAHLHIRGPRFYYWSSRLTFFTAVPESPWNPILTILKWM